MRNKKEIQNTDQPSTDYPMGRIRNDQGGIGIGTPIVEELYGDIHETVTYFMEESKTVPNDLPDNYTNGHQIAEAIKEVGGKFDRMHSLITELNTMRIDARLDNMKVGEFLTIDFKGEDTNEFKNKINDTYNLNFPLDITGVEGDIGRLVKINSTSFSLYVYKNNLDNSKNTINVITKGVRKVNTNAPEGLININHSPVDLQKTSVMYTFERIAPGVPVSEKIVSISHCLAHREANGFDIMYSGMLEDTEANITISISWWLVEM